MLFTKELLCGWNTPTSLEGGQGERTSPTPYIFLLVLLVYRTWGMLIEQLVAE